MHLLFRLSVAVLPFWSPGSAGLLGLLMAWRDYWRAWHLGRIEPCSFRRMGHAQVDIVDIPFNVQPPGGPSM